MGPTSISFTLKITPFWEEKVLWGCVATCQTQPPVEDSWYASVHPLAVPVTDTPGCATDHTLATVPLTYRLACIDNFSEHASLFVGGPFWDRSFPATGDVKPDSVDRKWILHDMDRTAEIVTRQNGSDLFSCYYKTFDCDDREKQSTA